MTTLAAGGSLAPPNRASAPSETIDVGRKDVVPTYCRGLAAEALRDIPEFGAFAVVVLGGGAAGIAAATTAAELGHRTLLIERHGLLGGAPYPACPARSAACT